MCKRCLRARAQSIPLITTALADSNNSGANLLGDLLQAAEYVDDGSINEAAGRIRVETAMGNSYATSRRDALTLASWLIGRLHVIKQRIVDEAIAQIDPYAFNARWDELRNGFYITTTSAPDAEPTETFEPRLEGETRGAALLRLALLRLEHTEEPDDE